MRLETFLTNEQANCIKEVFELLLREFHNGEKARDTNYDYVKMIYEGLRHQHEGSYKIYTDESIAVAQIIHDFNVTANNPKYEEVENYLYSQKLED